jgi:hypothetical protein
MLFIFYCSHQSSSWMWSCWRRRGWRRRMPTVSQVSNRALPCWCHVVCSGQLKDRVRAQWRLWRVSLLLAACTLLVASWFDSHGYVCTRSMQADICSRCMQSSRDHTAVTRCLCCRLSQTAPSVTSDAQTVISLTNFSLKYRFFGKSSDSRFVLVPTGRAWARSTVYVCRNWRRNNLGTPSEVPALWPNQTSCKVLSWFGHPPNT